MSSGSCARDQTSRLGWRAPREERLHAFLQLALVFVTLAGWCLLEGASRRRRRDAFTWLQAAWFLAACFLVPGVAAAQEAVTLVLEDEMGLISELEVGRSLFIWAGGLGAGSYEVAAWVGGEPIDPPLPLVVGETGLSEPILVWGATGIVGCDCLSETGGRAYARFEHALEELVGLSVSVELRESSGLTVASVSVPVIEPRRPVAFTADASGCPRFHFTDSEDLFLIIRGGSPGERFRSRLSLHGSDLVEDVRKGSPEDHVFQLTPPETRSLLWSGDVSSEGDWLPGLIRWGWSSGYPLIQRGGINSGVVVADHSCPSPPPPP